MGYRDSMSAAMKGPALALATAKGMVTAKATGKAKATGTGKAMATERRAQGLARGMVAHLERAAPESRSTLLRRILQPRLRRRTG
jgi:hypothetical protein